ncbi:condensation domain-containing protein [Kribbella sp. NBC_01505]|uniref:condensation domain-containing protein n=1 Tax=Kribbella sp. NBC_01505 TaxID=2903580 RepID=UPI003864DFE6
MTVATPITPGQAGLWFLHLLAPSNPAYNSCTAIELIGPLSPIALRAAIAHIGRCHETMRAIFGDDVNGEPSQVFAAEPPTVRLVDLTALPEDRRTAEIDGQLRRLAGLPFDLRSGPPVRWVLVRCGPARHVLAFDAHHIGFDFDSLAVVCRDLERGYTAAVSGSRLLGDPRLRSDASLAARAWTPDGWAEQDLRFWQSSLSGTPLDHSLLPTDRSRSEAAVRHVASYDRAGLTRLADLCAAEKATTFMAFAAALVCLISRYTGRREIVVGVAVSLRDTARYADVVGLLINVLPLRVRIDQQSAFRAVLRSTRDAVLDALDHRWTPLHRIVGSADLRPAEGTPLFEVLLTHERHAAPPTLPRLQVATRQVGAATAKHQLTVTLTESADRLTVGLESDERRCSRAHLASWNADLTALVTAISRDPDVGVTAVPLDLAGVARGAAGDRGSPGGVGRTTDNARRGTPPRTELERRLAAGWCSVLGVPEVDVGEGFFEAGGTSLAMLRLHRQLVDEVASDLTVAELFRYPTVAALARYLSGRRATPRSRHG